MFQFPTFAHLLKVCRRLADGLPHSEIRGSRDICSSPRLFAAYHVLLRLREPRHPPFALAYFLLPSVSPFPVRPGYEIYFALARYSFSFFGLFSMSNSYRSLRNVCGE